MSTFGWTVKKWYLGVRLKMLRRQVRGLQREFFRKRRKSRSQQLQLPFRG